MSEDNAVYLQGPVMFSNVFEFNMVKNVAEGGRSKYAPLGGQFTIDIGLDDKDARLVKSWNKRYKPRVYNEQYADGVVDDLSYFQFKRKNYNKVDEWGGPPIVLDENNQPWPEGTFIGNGSICTLKLDVYNGSYVDDAGVARPYTSVRLDGIRVDKLVEYHYPNKEETEDEVEEEAPAPKRKKKGVPF